ncbi:hypothetical protein IEQ34_008742 [Dendrobium chrysotoxum]|uniref:Uncharacterized protein n=1 Tax=Dendrobium chrysotoxum TaxID=161865 RepID=A0AAV7GYR9_DENCH|nr:hypothetical protein IEQ34_008742 [Dendrobium chrysotoxum]
MLVTMGLIALFRDREATLTPEHLSRMGRFTSDTHGHVTFRSKWLDLRTRDPLKNWANAFFFVKKDWGMLEKWGKMKDLTAPLHVGEEDIMRIFQVPDIEHFLFEVRHMTRYIEEEFLFKEARDHIYDIEVEALEQQCIEDGFIRGFLKGVRLMQRQTGVQVEGVTPSQASDNFSSGSNGDEIESELQKAFDLDVDEIVDIE